MVDRKPGEARDKVRDSHHPVDILTRDAIPASFGLEQAGELMETDKTKWFIWAATSGWLLSSECDPEAACFATGTIIAAVLGKILRRVMTQPGVGHEVGAGGMPSTHALGLFYIASYFSTQWLSKCAITIQQVADKQGNTAHGGVSHATPLHALAAVAETTGLAVASATMILVSGALAYRRAQIGQHSTKEVTYGIAFGALYGMLWKLTAGDPEFCLKPLSTWMFSHGFHGGVVVAEPDWEKDLVQAAEIKLKAAAFGYAGAAVLCLLSLAVNWDGGQLKPQRQDSRKTE